MWKEGAMETENKDFWSGLRASAQERLAVRDYSERVVGASDVEVTIPGVALFPRKVFHQGGRGFFAEFAREGEGTAGEIGMWPRQWATARMYSPSAKGFHIHPPHIPEGEEPAAWFQKLFGDAVPEGGRPARPYPLEQWDMMFFLQGRVEFLLVDERAGMPRETMRFYIDGDNMPGPDNVGLVIPAGVAHALRTACGEDLLMVYGTSTTFEPANEGRIAHGVEAFPLPADWEEYLRGNGEPC
jgi:dTDP-4-dehydrorhamnose 3,5-epimerase-like enzyme